MCSSDLLPSDARAMPMPACVNSPFRMFSRCFSETIQRSTAKAQDFGSPPQVQPVTVNVIQNSVAGHVLRVVARDARQRAVPDERPESPALSLDVDEVERSSLVTRRRNCCGGCRGRRV